eukprot:m51a1_g1383 hypothetical protein (313) ;mRNA; f:453459-454493
METLHCRVLPAATHTLDDLVFAAFQGPVLGLNARVLHRYRSFTALLLMRTRWRTERRLSQADAATALLKARCRVPGTLATAECRLCGGVLNVSENVAEQENLRRGLPHDIELYAATLRTRCTSSRKHVGSTMLVLAADLAPGFTVVSDRFAIYARHAARHVAGAKQGGGGATAEQSSPPEGGWGDSPVDEAAVLQSLAVGSPVGADLRSLRPAGLIIGVSINVLVAAPEEQQMFTCALASMLRSHVPGFLMQKASMGCTVVTLVGAFFSQDAYSAAMLCGWQFVRNEIRNPLNRNLLSEGIVQPILSITNMD